MTDDRIAALCDALAATEERPLDRSANRWLGEAQAVAEDLRGGVPDDATLVNRLETVDHLLAQVDSTGDGEADAALDRATAIVTGLLSDLNA